ncbi:hypothetical protein [Jatrophihabitans sp. GAS493]|uniref:hypothetical protein n=1 Tax=Jatrophihabitans sp. GAS493 TaxID=1907575 RepID=UPI0012FE13C2|nr:hypothetical protein [Jatrophihabitans sp. GAS493]
MTTPPPATTMAQQQRELVAALVNGGPTPAGFNAGRVEAAARALLRKRAGEVGRAWPGLRHGLGEQWQPGFIRWARHRPKAGSFADGFAFALERQHYGRLPAGARLELATALLDWRLDAAGDLVRRRWFIVRTTRVDRLRLYAFGGGRRRWRWVRSAD